MRRRALLALSAVLVAAALAACEAVPPPPTYPPISFADKPKLRLDAADIVVVRPYAMPGRPPHVEHLFPVIPADAVERWARERLVAAGARGTAEVRILDAGVVEVPLPRTGGIRGLFTTDQAVRYEGALEVEIALVGRADRSRASVRARVERRRSAPENISPAGREKLWYDMTVAMMTDLDAALEKRISETFEAPPAR